jgi:class 3 adenylate cyclase
MANVERKLAAILSADVVAYSRLMAEDEAATIRTLTDYRAEIAMLVRQHRGRVVASQGWRQQGDGAYTARRRHPRTHRNAPASGFRGFRPRDSFRSESDRV